MENNTSLKKIQSAGDLSQHMDLMPRKYGLAFIQISDPFESLKRHQSESNFFMPKFLGSTESLTASKESLTSSSNLAPLILSKVVVSQELSKTPAIPVPPKFHIGYPMLPTIPASPIDSCQNIESAFKQPPARTGFFGRMRSGKVFLDNKEINAMAPISQ